MKSILKFAVILLLLFAMIGTASAAIDADSVKISAPVLNGTDNYTIDVTWTGTSGATSNNFTVSVSPTVTLSPADLNTTGLLMKLEGPFALNTEYTVTVTDSDGGVDSEAFTILSAPVSADFDDFKVSTSGTDSNFSLTWTWNGVALGSGANDLHLEIYNNSASDWNDLGAATSATVIGDPDEDAKFIFRFQKEGSYSENFTYTTLPAIKLSTSHTSDSITWKIDNFASLSYWDKYEIIDVLEGSSSVSFTTGQMSDLNSSLQSGSLELNSTHSLDPAKEYTLIIRGVNGTDIFGLHTSAKSVVAPTELISSFEPSKYYNASKGETQEAFSIESDTLFNLTVKTTDDSKFRWKLEFNDSGSLNDVSSEISKNDTSSDKRTNDLEWKPTKKGEYVLTLVIEDDANSALKQELKWVITVTEKSTGNRIWTDGMPTTYTWDARSFAGFYYDLDTGMGSESMTITGIGRSLERDSITYTTKASNVKFEYDSWGDYQIVGFMGDKYYAGSGTGSDSESLMKTGNLSKVLIDTDESGNYRVGQSIALEEGYSIFIDQISVSGNQALLVIQKDGKDLATGIVNSGGTFVYEKNISNVKIPFIRVHVNSVFQGSESSLITIDGLFQISDQLTKLESGTRIDKMEITSVSGDQIEMTNRDRISLSQDSEVVLMGKMKFLVADNSTLKFAPTIEYTDPGVYEIRGTVSDFSDSKYVITKWTPENFEGFYYNINDDIGDSESIEITQSLDNSSRRIDKGNLTYSANTTVVDYEYAPWNNYSVVGFMGSKYYAGTNGALLKGGNLSKVLIDADESRRMNVGQSLTLEEGYSLKIDQIDVNGNSTYVILEKDGKRVTDGIVRSGNDFVYKKNISGTDVEFIKVHVDSVFMGTESSLVSITGLFQASEELTKLENDAKYGRMRVDSFSSTGITLSNDDSISLSAGNDVEFMKVGNQTMYFKVGDNNTLRFAPVVEREIGSTTPLEVKLTPSAAVEGETVLITVSDRGTTIEGVSVSVNGSSIGTTSSDGTLNYTTSAVGSFRVLAEKSGYVNGTATLTVDEKLGNMTVRISPDVIHYGETGTIKVTDSVNGSAIAGAAVTVGSNAVGTTDSEGQLNYTFNSTGNITVMASKEKYNNATGSVNISQRVAFVYSNFELKPTEPAAKGNTKVSFDVTNSGIESGSHELMLIVTDSSGNVVDQDSKNVSVNIGKTKGVTLSFKAPAEGTYTLTLKENDSGRVVDLPSHISTVSVGPAKLIGSTLIYIILAILALIILVIIGVVAYLFGVKGATTSNYKEVAGEVTQDLKSKFKK